MSKDSTGTPTSAQQELKARLQKKYQTTFEDAFSEEVWSSTYKDHQDQTINDTLYRVAAAAASVESTEELQVEWTEKFYDILTNFKATAGGRIYANAGTEWKGTTLMNCIAADTIVHTIDGPRKAGSLSGEVMTLSEGGVYRPATWYSYGEQPLYEVKLENGDTIFATAQHEWVVTIPGGGRQRIKTVDLLGHRIPFQPIGVEPEHTLTAKIVEVNATNRVEEVFCCVEPETHTMVIGNGYLTGQCFVGPRVKNDVDSLDGILTHLRSQAYTLKSEGGWGENFSYIRPRGSFIHGIGVETPGAVKYMELFDKSSEIITSGSGKKSHNKKAKGKIRKGAMMAVMDCFADSTVILTDNGWVNVVDVVEMLEEGKPVGIICEDGKAYAAKNPVIRPPEQLYRVEAEDGTFIEVTGDHKFEVQDIKTGKIYLKAIKEVDAEKEMLKIIQSPLLKIAFKKLKSITPVGSDNSYDFEVESTHRIIAKHTDSENAFYTSNCWHPDVVEFITAKQQPGRLTKFNVSVNCTDEFMNKVTAVLKTQKQLALLEDAAMIYGKAQEESEQDILHLKQKIEELDKWHLRFPDTTFAKYKKEWDGNLIAWEAKKYPVKVFQTVSALWLWNLIMESTYNRAEPGVLFLDRANYFLPLNYAETVFATNPCVTADTWVHTTKGPRQVSELLSNQHTILVNGEEHAATNFFATGNKDIYELKGKHGYSVKLTADHKVLINRGDEEPQWIEAQNIQPGDRLVLNNHRKNITWSGEGNKDEGYLMGLAVGDGWISSDKVTLSVYERGENTNTGIWAILEKVKTIHQNLTGQTAREWWHSEERGEYRYYSPLMNGLAKQFNLTTSKQIGSAIEKASSEFYQGFISGLFDADGTVIGDIAGGASVRLWQADVDMLKTVQRMLHRLGIMSTLYENRELAQEKMMPDGRGGSKSYNCVAQHELSISKESMVRFCDIVGFTDSTKSSKLGTIVDSYQRGPYKDKFEDEFASLTPVGNADVYDVSVPGINAFDANGIYVHNCGEQVLAPGGVCNLASLNLTQFVNKDRTGFDLKRIEKYTRYLVRFLDDINDLTTAPLPEYEYNIRNKRRIGVGILGWGSALYMLQTRFASEEANQLRDQVMRTIARASYMASIELAEEKGMFAECEPKWHVEGPFVKSLDLPADYMERLAKTGIRNSSLLSVQPTGNCVTKDGQIMLSATDAVSIEQLIESAGLDIAHLTEGDIIRLDRSYKIPTFEGEDSFDSIYVNGHAATLDIQLETGAHLTCTENHKYLVKIDDTTADWVQAKDLVPGMKIISLPNNRDYGANK